MSLVPLDEESELTVQRMPIQGHQDAAKSFGLHRADEALNHGDAAVLSYSSEALANAATPAPCTKRVVRELAAVVRSPAMLLRVRQTISASWTVASISLTRATLGGMSRNDSKS